MLNLVILTHKIPDIFAMRVLAITSCHNKLCYISEFLTFPILKVVFQKYNKIIVKSMIYMY